MDPVTNFEALCYLVFLYSFVYSLYRCETWSLMLRKEHGLKIFENMIMREGVWAKKGQYNRGEEKTT